MTGAEAAYPVRNAATPAWRTATTAAYAPANRRPAPAGWTARGRAATGVDGRPHPAPLVSTDELTMLRLIAEGLPIDAVAHRMETSPRTVRRRMRNLCDRIGATCAIQAVVWAARRGLV
jgi:DNA-binding NarL/FixJ family response regulator